MKVDNSISDSVTCHTFQLVNADIFSEFWVQGYSWGENNEPISSLERDVSMAGEIPAITMQTGIIILVAAKNYEEYVAIQSFAGTDTNFWPSRTSILRDYKLLIM